MLARKPWELGRPAPFLGEDHRSGPAVNKWVQKHGRALSRVDKYSANQGIAAERSKEWPREDEAEVGAFHSTDESGEPTSAGSLWR